MQVKLKNRLIELSEKESRLTQQYFILRGQADEINRELAKVQTAIAELKGLIDDPENVPGRGPDNNDQPQG